MPYIRLPITWGADDPEKYENLKIEPKGEEGYIYVNSVKICAFNGTDSGNTLIRLSNGENFEINMDEDELCDLLESMENVVMIGAIGEN